MDPEKQKKVYSKRCGLLEGFLGCSWPFGGISVFEDKIAIEWLFLDSYFIFYDEIIFIKKCGFLPFSFPFFGKGIKIKTRNKIISRSLVIYLNNNGEVYNLIKKLMEKKGLNPFGGGSGKGPP